MPRNTSITLGEHFESFVSTQIKKGRFNSKSEVVRAAMRLLEEHEHDFQEKLVTLRQKLAIGDAQLEAGQGIDGETFMKELIDG